MKYLGIAKAQKGKVIMPDTFEVQDGDEFEAMEVGGDIILLPSRISMERRALIERLIEITIGEHRDSLEKLAK